MATFIDEPICVIDEDPLHRERMTSWLKCAGYRVYNYPSGGKFLADAEMREAACLVIDTGVSDIDGLKLQRALEKLGRREQIVFFASKPSIPACVAAMRAGAVDYQEKPVVRESLLSAVAEGVRRSAAVADLRSIRRDAVIRLKQLTRREKEVMSLLIQGFSNRRVGATLQLAEATVKIHRRHVMEKTGAKSLPELVVLAQNAGVDPTAGLLKAPPAGLAVRNGPPPA